MSWWMFDRLRIAVAGLCLATAACSSSDDGDDGSGSEADAGPDAGGIPGLDAGPACDPGGGGGEAIDLILGLRSLEKADAFTELADGDQADVVLGFQGLYMLLLETRGPLPIEQDAVCLACSVELSPVGEFRGAMQAGNVSFDTMPTGGFRGPFTLIVGAQSEKPDIEGAEVELSMSCNGHGVTGTVERSLRLVPE
jgi:hypothetical protein